ncbi:hypothetical protein [Streptomyces europaeiscabiei]|uniref:hypothetical protein n=1 Tax=Streptomyces europaeiscabiei TaxID=146819 RepID=UPI0038F623F7
MTMTTDVLPLAQDLDRSPDNPHAFHNQVRKAMATAFELFHHDLKGQPTAEALMKITRDDMVRAADRVTQRIGGAVRINPPKSDESENLVRLFLLAIWQGRNGIPADVSGTVTAAVLGDAHVVSAIPVLPPSVSGDGVFMYVQQRK